VKEAAGEPAIGATALRRAGHGRSRAARLCRYDFHVAVNRGHAARPHLRPTGMTYTNCWEQITSMGGGHVTNNRNHAWSWWYLLLLLQFVPALWVPLYNTAEPSFIGMPFFYWFQLALVFASAAVTAIVYWATE